MLENVSYVDLADWHGDMCDTVEIVGVIQLAMEEIEGDSAFNRALLGAYHSLQQQLEMLQQLYEGKATLKIVGKE